MTYGTYDVSVLFGDVRALDTVTLTAPSGQISAVVGGDGAGKTTLLRTLVGRLVPDSGTVTAPEPRRIGYQPATGGTWPDLTVSENLAFVGGMYGLSPRTVRERSARLLERAQLGEASDRLARNLSGGMRTKLGFCLAMVHEPDLLVLDEPSTGVDPVSRVELWRLLSETAAAGTAVALATTYLDEGERASSVLVLEAGRVLLSGSAEDVVAASPGVVVQTRAPVRPEFSWRHSSGFREWWPVASPNGEHPVERDLEDTTIVAALRAQHGDGDA